MRILTVILLLITISGYSQVNYFGEPTTASLLKTNQIRKTISPGSGYMYVIGTIPSYLNPAYHRIQDSATIASYGVDQTLSLFSVGTYKLTHNFGASDFIHAADSSSTNEIQTISRYLLGLKLTNGAGNASTFLSLPDSSSTNEGLLSVGAGGANSSTIVSNTPTSPDITINGAGIISITELSNAITITGTEVDGSISNEGVLSVGAGTGTTSLIKSNSSTSPDITITAGGIISLSESGNNITISATEADGNPGNEGRLTLGAGTSTTTLIQSNSTGSTDITVSAAGDLTISESGNLMTLGYTDGDKSATNEGSLSVNDDLFLATARIASNTSGSSDITIAVSGDITVAETTNKITLGYTDGDKAATNEGSLSVNAGTGSTSILHSNTSGSSDVTVSVAGDITISESGNLITLGYTDGDKSATNEIQTLSRYLLGLKLTNGSSASTFLSLPDSSSSNEGVLSVGAGTGTTSLIKSNSSTSPDITITAAGINTISESGNNITITGTEVDGSVTNEIQTLSIFANKGTIKLTNGGAASTFIQLADSTISNEGSLSVLAGSSSNSIIHSNTSTSADITIAVTSPMTITESGNLITLGGAGAGTLKHIKAGTQVYEKGIDVAINGTKDTATISLNYPTMVTVDSFLSNKADWVAVSRVVADVTNNSKITAFNFKKERTRTITTSKNFDADDSQGIVILNGNSITYTLESSPVDGEEVSFVNLQSSLHPVVSGNGKNINGSGSYTFTAQYEKIKIRYFESLTKWLIIP